MLFLAKEISISVIFPRLMGLLVCVHMLLCWPIFAADLPLCITPKVGNKNRSYDNKRALILTVVALFPKSTYKLL